MAAKKGAPQQETVNVKQLFLELVRSEKSRDYERGLRTCNRILKVLQNDEKTFHCKIVCLIQLGQFEEALQCLRKYSVPNTAQNGYDFEKAYCLYRLNRMDEALDAITNTSDSRALELRAQLLYRKESYSQCLPIFEQLIRNVQDEFEEERKTNLFAVLTQMRVMNELAKAYRPPTPTNYEQWFNYACFCLAEQNLSEAMKALRLAEEHCQKAVDEDELEQELGLIKCQQAYCAQVQGHTDEASSQYTALLKQQKGEDADASLVAVAANNLVAIHKDQLLFDSRKKMKLCTSKELEHKLLSAQKRGICYNNALVQLYSGQYDQCRASIDDLQKRYASTDKAVLLQAAVLARQKQLQNAQKVLQEYLKATSGQKHAASVTSRLALAQLHYLDGRLRQAWESLRADPELSCQPAVVSVGVAMYLSEQNTADALNILEEAIKHHRATKADWNVLAVLMEEAATICASAGKPQDASQYLEQLRQLRPNDVHVLARLIKAYSQFDSKKAEELSKQLATHIDASTAGASDSEGDIEDVAMQLLRPKYGVKQRKDEGLKGDEAAKKKRHKRKRKVKLPKNHDPNVPPDPERWLPKYERSTYYKKKTKKQREREVGRGTQGSAGVDLQLDSSATAKPSPGGKVTTPTSPPGGSGTKASQQQPKAAAKKKKGKGGKW